MTRPKDLNPWDSPRAFYGTELRRHREAAGLSQDELGALVFCSGAYIGQMESATRRPPKEMAKLLDAVLKTDGILTRMCEAMEQASQHAEYFRLAAELEAMASAICEYAPMIVPGLLQTPEYTRALIRASRPFAGEEFIEKSVATRRERAQLLDGPELPEVWFIVHELVLTTAVGGAEVMRTQLAHFIELIEQHRVLVQVIPTAEGPHPLMDGPFRVMDFTDAPPVVYTESAYSGQLLDSPALVASYVKTYDLGRAAALPPKASLQMIQAALEDYAA
ncbi:helix-turn-helix transcriptional regulator [Streptomyces sp. ASQP_92]|uniref:helix-turn-helix domain-containing protein n=1 Tax=Streptomyces sp. ASQP_92 TaxID=2979116 RepID=UPI0021C0E8F7|nr:helix-turn-helix transcriptional regulator [Streptomyces sp. ASQP_92]MCT9092744.1 helix-turn-helix transcriptional regulator [Streptomyces sp. ASQP_92]